MKRTKIDAVALKVGMYVAQLDRPWLETPFLFQGFEIRDDSEIKQLQECCEHAYIDITRSSLPAADIEKLLSKDQHSDKLISGAAKQKAPAKSLGFKIMRSLSKLDPTGVLERRVEGIQSYRVKASLQKEMPKASGAYEIALSAVDDVLNRVRDGKIVDVNQVREAVNPMIESVLRNPSAMTWFVLLKKRDSYSYNHSIASSVWATVLGRHLGFDRTSLDTLALGAMLLDIGKARIPEELLQKHPLDDGDMEIFRQHVPVGLEIAQQTPDIPQEALDMIACHHERLDGSGYPKSLAGTDIPVYGRIAGLVDCYDAMTTNRPSASAMSSYEAIRELNSLADVHFQKELVEQFVQALGMFPAGSIVELNSGEVGIVVEQNRVRRLRPKIMLVLDSEKKPVKKHKTVDLRSVSGDARDEKSRWIIVGHEAGAFGIDPAHYFIG